MWKSLDFLVWPYIILFFVSDKVWKSFCECRADEKVL